MKSGIRSALGIIISLACLYFSFRNFQWADAIAQARNANYLLLALATVAATMMFPLRARRWRTILDPVAPKLPFGPLWRATAIGVMMTNLLPARAGELARPYALSREIPSVPFSMSLASVAVDRVFDGIVVLLLLAVSMLVKSFPSGVMIEGHSVGRLALGVAIPSVVLLVGLYALVFFPNQLIRLFELLARRVSPTLERKGSDMLRKFSEGLSVLRNPGHFAAVFFWTLLHWLVQPLAFWLGFRAFGIDVPPIATLFVQGAIVIFVAVPSTPGFVGVFEAGAIASLAVYGVDRTLAGTWALVFHIASYIPITLIGAYYFARAGLSLGEIGSARNAEA
jgi:hypothetical protein